MIGAWRLRRAIGLLTFVGLTLGAAVATGLHWGPTHDRSGEVTVETVLDGDTIALSNGERVRLAQIDTPELTDAECYADIAQRTLAGLLPTGTRVRLERDRRLSDSDDFGRLIRYVFLGEMNVNLELVRQGAASVWFVGARGRYARELLKAARRAKRSAIGLWVTCPLTRLDASRGVETGLSPTATIRRVPRR